MFGFSRGLKTKRDCDCRGRFGLDLLSLEIFKDGISMIFLWLVSVQFTLISIPRSLVSLLKCILFVSYLAPSFNYTCLSLWAFEVAQMVQNLPANAGDISRSGFDPWTRKTSWRRTQPPTPVFLPGEPHGHRGVWWATIHRVTKSWTQLK